jgi:hypothetical protein
MAGLNGLTPTLYQVLQIMPMGVPVTPTQINDHIGKGNYASKHILYLKILGYDFDTNKDGRSVVSYTLTKVPDNHQVLIDNASGKGSKTKVAKAPKVAKAKTVTVIVPSNLDTAITGAKVQVVPKIKAPKKVAAKKSVADIKASNLAKLKAVGQRFKAEQVQVLTEAPASTSFSIDNDWDSVEGLDLKNLIG